MLYYTMLYYAILCYTMLYSSNRSPTTVSTLTEGDEGKRFLPFIASYRGGYTKEERRLIEQDLFNGRLLGVTTTSALELGIGEGY